MAINSLSPSVSYQCVASLTGHGQGDFMDLMLAMITVNDRMVSISQLGAGSINNEIPELGH